VALGRLKRLPGQSAELDELREQLREARASEVKYRSIVENATEGIFQTNPEGSVLVSNPALAKMLGFTSVEELLASELNLGALYTDVEQRQELQRRLAETGTITNLELQARGADGRHLWISLNCHAVLDENGSLLGIGGTAVDMTARKEAQDALAALNAELEQRIRDRTAELERRNADLKAFTFSVSHDLRAPLRAMAGFSEILLDEYGSQLEEKGRRYVERVKAASIRMGQLIDDVLHLSRVSEVEMRTQTVDLSAIARGVAAELQALEPARRVDFEIQAGIVARADRQLIATVLENLLGNAWKFTAPHDHGRIDFVSKPSGPGVVECYVSDDGVGFDPTYKDALFQPFRRLHSSEFAGTGVGLASVRRIVERHGGRTWAEGEVGKGASFHFTLAIR
jgi:PAS domain S-box-containing protein